MVVVAVLGFCGVMYVVYVVVAAIIFVRVAILLLSSIVNYWLGYSGGWGNCMLLTALIG